MIEGSDFLTIALLVALEGLLSADNALVIAVMVLGLPKEQHRGALHYGLIGAFAFRIVATLLAIYLMQVVWVKLLGGLYLLYLTYSHFKGGKTAEERQSPPKARPWLGLSAFWATVVRVELVNLASRSTRSSWRWRCRRSGGSCSPAASSASWRCGSSSGS
jgi:YkoY family integral membrane protein